jgi:RsmE family RNA methyltransferase
LKHVPHLYVPEWPDNSDLTPTDAQRRHLQKVLRIDDGAVVEYTDGAGRSGKGVWTGSMIERGEEVSLARPSLLTLAVAPPSNKDRQRFVVEKLAELGVARLLWLRTTRGANRLPAAQKSSAWAISALEQSRGAWLLEVGPGLVEFAELDRPLAVCDVDGVDSTTDAPTVAVGPEGGFEAGEIPADASTFSLGTPTLRVETAAVVAAARLV